MPPDVMMHKANPASPGRPRRWQRWPVACILMLALLALTALLPQHGSAQQADQVTATVVLMQHDAGLDGHAHVDDPACHATAGCAQSMLAASAVPSRQVSISARVVITDLHVPRSLRLPPALKPPIA